MKEQNQNIGNSNRVNNLTSATASTYMFKTNPRLSDARTKLNEALADVSLEVERVGSASDENEVYFNRFIDCVNAMESCIEHILQNISKYDDVVLDDDLTSEDEA